MLKPSVAIKPFSAFHRPFRCLQEFHYHALMSCHTSTRRKGMHMGGARKLLLYGAVHMLAARLALSRRVKAEFAAFVSTDP